MKIITQAEVEQMAAQASQAQTVSSAATGPTPGAQVAPIQGWHIMAFKRAVK